MAEPLNPVRSKRLHRVGLGLCVSLMVLAGGLWGIETWMQARYLRIARSDRMDPGLTRPDPELGWRLTPSWRGSHTHHDFAASYTIHGGGFRNADAAEHPRTARCVALVGDSFTFGIGVNDAEVFPALLDRAAPAVRRVYNFAVPGFSTDQEVLLVEREVLKHRPDVLLLVVYLANDLFDNQLPAALQVRRPKPYFVLEGSRLVLSNSPVPAVFVERSDAPNLLDMVLGTERAGASARQRLEGRSHLFRMLSESVLPIPADDATFDARHDYALRLFWALFQRLEQACAPQATRVGLVLMAGRSFVESPASLSAQFQDYFRRRLGAGAKERAVPVIDVAEALRVRYHQSPSAFYFPNEGHLNADGHRAVAEILGSAIEGLTAAAP